MLIYIAAYLVVSAFTVFLFGGMCREFGGAN